MTHGGYLFGHYYGDVVRRLFIAGGVVMVFTLPFFEHLLPGPYFVSILVMLAVGVAAGLTNPRQNWAIILDVAISLFTFVIFEYHAATNFPDKTEFLYWVTQGLAILFFFALYFSIKSARGAFMKGRVD